MIRLLTGIGLALMTAQAFAQVQVPKSYSDGEVIYADELNTNLKAIADAVPPRDCTTEQIIKWNGSAWVCADMPSANDGGDGAAYGSPVWVDSSGILLSGREGQDVLWRVNGEIRDIGMVEDGVFVRRVITYYYSPDCSGEIAGYRADSIGDLWVTNGVLHEEGALLESTPLYNSYILPPGTCSRSSGETAGFVHLESSVGVAAPSWATDGTPMFADLR